MGDAEPLGRRMIVLSESAESRHPAAATNTAITHRPKSLWLTRSHDAAAKHRQELEAAGRAPIWQLSRDGNEAAVFADAGEGHLICAGRYDGIDLPGDKCRLVVVTDLPRAVDLQEQFLSEQLRDASFLLERLNARILQALGRANRSRDDFAVYVLHDPRFAAHLQRDTNRASLPARVNAEIDIAQDATQESAAVIASQVSVFLRRDFDEYDAAVADASQGALPQPAAAPAVSAADEVEGWRRMRVEDFVGAEQSFSAWAGACQAAGLREQAAFAFVCQARASLLAGRDGDLSAQARARELIDRAIGAGGIRSTWFNGLRASIAVTEPAMAAVSVDEGIDKILTTFDLRATADGGNRTRFERFRARVNDKLSSGTHAEFQEGLEDLGRLLGFDAVRPRGTGATDTRWGWSEGGQRQLLVWEAKIDHAEHNALSISDVDQANGQLTAARSEHGPRGAICRGAIVSHLEPDAAAAGRLGDITLVPRGAVVALWERIAAVHARYLDSWHPDDASARRQAIADVEGVLPPDRWLTRALDTHATAGEAELLADWH